jgi:hypothetical protein
MVMVGLPVTLGRLSGGRVNDRLFGGEAMIRPSHIADRLLICPPLVRRNCACLDHCICSLAMAYAID